MIDRRLFTDKFFVVLAAGICTLLWGSAYPAIKIGYEVFRIAPDDVPSKLIFAGYRFVIAGLMVLIAAWFMHRTLRISSVKEFSNILLLGIFQTTIQYAFFYIGLAHTTGVNGSIMNATGAFFSVIFAHFIYKNDRLNGSKIVGCLVGFIGVMIVNFSHDLMHFNFNLYGDGFVVIAAMLLSGASIYGKKLSESMNAILLTGYQLLFGGILLTSLGYIMGGTLSNFSFNADMLLLYMGFLSAAAFALWTILLKYNNVGKISVYNFLIPVFGAVLSAIFLGESILQWKNVAALLMVCMGIYIVNRVKE